MWWLSCSFTTNTSSSKVARSDKGASSSAVVGIVVAGVVEAAEVVAAAVGVVVVVEVAEVVACVLVATGVVSSDTSIFSSADVDAALPVALPSESCLILRMVSLA